jgi:electron transfer flavoprotein beta subunit
MNIAVCLNQVPDTSTRVRIAPDGKSIDPSGVTYVINPYDEYALEEALKLREKFTGVITVFSIGGDEFQSNIRKALAMGADKAVLLNAPVKDSHDVASVLASEIKAHFGGTPDFVFLGKESTDYNNAQVGPMIAEALDIPAVTVVVALTTDGKTATLEREIEGGKEIIEAGLPMVVTAQKGLNTPRVPNMKGIMDAKKKPLETKDAAVTSSAKSQLISLAPPPQKQAGKIVATAAELAQLLHSEAKVV